MSLIIGIFSIVIALFMLLLINLFSQAFPTSVVVGNDEIVKNYFSFDNTIYPICTIIIGIIFLVYYFLNKNKKI